MINLYSGLTDTYITKLADGKFRVFVPITKEYNNKKLNAYYIKDNGDVEVHAVKIEDGYAVFETDHFSTYTIGDTSLTNPNTFDNIMTWIMLSIISIIGILVVVIYKSKRLMNY